jgi:hypothetical protein
VELQRDQIERHDQKHGREDGSELGRVLPRPRPGASQHFVRRRDRQGIERMVDGPEEPAREVPLVDLLGVTNVPQTVGEDDVGMEGEPTQ